MELQNAISRRFSCRKFKDKDVDDELLRQLVESARLSPSAKNRQPWLFTILRGGGGKDCLVDLMIAWHKANPGNKTSVHSTAKCVKNAPILMLVFRTNDLDTVRSDTLSIGAAIEHILLTATAKGLGSLWICDTWYVKDEISKLVGIEHDLYSAIAIGWPDETARPRPRKKLDEILKFRY